jgi:hypothetical protein
MSDKKRNTIEDFDDPEEPVWKNLSFSEKF